MRNKFDATCTKCGHKWRTISIYSSCPNCEKKDLQSTRAELEAVKAERDRLQYEVKGLKTLHEESEKENDRLRGRLDELKNKFCLEGICGYIHGVDNPEQHCKHVLWAKQRQAELEAVKAALADEKAIYKSLMEHHEATMQQMDEAYERLHEIAKIVTAEKRLRLKAEKALAEAKNQTCNHVCGVHDVPICGCGCLEEEARLESEKALAELRAARDRYFGLHDKFGRKTSIYAPSEYIKAEAAQHSQPAEESTRNLQSIQSRNKRHRWKDQ